MLHNPHDRFAKLLGIERLQKQVRLTLPDSRLVGRVDGVGRHEGAREWYFAEI